MTQLTTSIIQKVKDELEVLEDISATELYDLLHKYRSAQHPDRFLDKERKVEAEEKFKRLNTLLLELSKYIELEKLQQKPSEIIPFQKDYEIVQSKQQLLNYEEIITNYKFSENSYKTEIKTLKNQIIKLQGDKADEITTDLINHYKPTKSNLLSQGITFLLTLTIGVLTKVDEVAILLKKYFPFNPIYLNYIIFGVLVFIPCRFLKNYYEEGRIENTAKKIRTPVFINKFLNYLTEKGIKDSFTEMNVYEFLQLELAPRNFRTRILQTYIFNLYNETTIDSLKDIFIYNLLNKQLISISSADQLDRKFKIARTHYYSIPNFGNDEINF